MCPEQRVCLVLPAGGQSCLDGERDGAIGLAIVQILQRKLPSAFSVMTLAEIELGGMIGKREWRMHQQHVKTLPGMIDLLMARVQKPDSKMQRSQQGIGFGFIRGLDNAS